jgi:hypothetical protein
MDRWEVCTHPGVTIGLCDAGYTRTIFWGDRLAVWHTSGHGIKYYKGTKEDLEKLYVGIVKNDEGCTQGIGGTH